MASLATTWKHTSCEPFPGWGLSPSKGMCWVARCAWNGLPKQLDS
jgi:hypothetical protein